MPQGDPRDTDIETHEWLESLDDVLAREGYERVRAILHDLEVHARKRGVRLPFTANTPYINTIPPEQEVPYPGSREIELRIKSLIRWNAMAMVVRANREESVVYKDFVHLGVAVDTDRGLLVPVIRDADRKNLIEIAVELSDFSRRARERTLAIDEMQGATFTISNLGGIGGTSFTPIIDWPQVAILGLSRASVEPVWRDGAFQPRTMAPLSLSYDHRLIDGADAARFTRWVAEALGDPFLVTLEGAGR